MFGIFADLLSSAITILFPAFASYKAIRSGNPAQLTPWLMYWVVLSGILLAESWTVFIIGWFPFYSWIRLFFLSYLVLPQTQGARILFQEYVDPFFEQHEREIEEFIGRSHERAKTIGLQYFYQLVDLIKEKVLGMPPQQQQQQAVSPHATGPAGYAQSLLSRFNLPSSGPGAPQGLVVGGDWYSLVTSALGAVTSSSTTTSPRGTRNLDAQAEQLSASGILHPDRVAKLSRNEKARFYSSQRERLEILVSALEKEERKLTPTTSNSSSSNNSDDDDAAALAYGYGHRPSSSMSKTRLRKNASEVSFDQIDADDLSGSTASIHHQHHNTNNHNNTHYEEGRPAAGRWTSGWFGGNSNSATASSKRHVPSSDSASSSSPGVEFAARAVDEIGRASGFSR
ncbi:hypothetical protein UA08_02567 [Talaromyces atroroseus]|uniref:Protein YOP1 n=1 Tax=Talaromyces atroroseus TaxID=1441469 RepID=A0A225B1X6_TALAT|nr:hypothetical protein UA08_02567 [Talaromyces atroroseus]OKL61969.1 hypothetical protein UA08_02567 [Talaromyces atroroseus]